MNWNHARYLFALILLSSLVGCAGVPIHGKDTPQWETFEISLPGPTSGNPFTDVNLSARFTDGHQNLEVDGFYDGDGIYRVRFMPPTMGKWTFVTRSNQSSLNKKTGSFTCIAPSQNNHGLVQPVNTFHFQYQDGSPYWCIGTTCYNWTHRSDDLENQTLQSLKDSPFDKVRMLILPGRDGTGDRKLIRYPFVGTPPKSWDFSSYNVEFFQHLDRRIRDLRDLGIQADVIFFNPYEEGHFGYPNMTPKQEDQYIRYVVARLGAYHNVWWSLANEYDLFKDKPESAWDHYFQVVKESDPYGHMLSVHHSLRIYNYTQPWVTHASIQNGSAVEDFGRGVLYRDVYNKPIVLDEVKYEGNIKNRWGQLTGEQMVDRFWHGVIDGVYVGHGEVLRLNSESATTQESSTQPTTQPVTTQPLTSWTSDGVTLRGQSAPRIAFLKKILKTAPPSGIDPIDKWQDVHTAGKQGEYYLIYFGTEKPDVWNFELPIKGLAAGTKFRVDVIDTQNMTITPIDQVFTIQLDGMYRVHDDQLSQIKLPGKPYMLIRLTRVE